MLIEEITINQFMTAWFKENYDLISKDSFEQAYCEYMDLSGLYLSKRFQQLSYINYLSVRVSSMRIAVQVQKDFLNTFGYPFEPGFSFFKKYSHILYWNNDKKQFSEYLDKVERREKKFVVDLQIKSKQFVEEEGKKKVEQKSVMQTRHEFIRTLNVLQKNGYKIDRNNTTVEELALIVKESIEESKNQK